jgi:ElaB/YqjD/DUF883 family membrane-anchored ribosome-binding protein
MSQPIFKNGDEPDFNASQKYRFLLRSLVSLENEFNEMAETMESLFEKEGMSWQSGKAKDWRVGERRVQKILKKHKKGLRYFQTRAFAQNHQSEIASRQEDARNAHRNDR